MTTADTGKYTMFTFDTSEIKTLDAMTKQVVYNSASALANVSNWMKSVEKHMKSATGNKDFRFASMTSEVDPQSRISTQRVVVQNEFADIFKEQLKYFETRHDLSTVKYPLSSTMRQEGAVQLAYRAESLYGKSALNKLKTEASAKGGFAEELGATVTSSGKNVFRAKAVVFMSESDFASKGASSLEEMFPETKKVSLVEKSKRDAIAKRKAIDEAERRKKEDRIKSDALTVATNKMMSKAEDEENKEIEKRNREQSLAYKNKLKEIERAKEEEHEENWGKFERKRRQEISAEKEKLASRRKLLSSIGIIVSTLTIIAAVVRRILSSALERTEESVKEKSNAFRLQLSQSQIRDMNLFDVAHGMTSGTSVSSIQGIARSFSNITRLNKDEIEPLAQLLGVSTGELVKGAYANTPPIELRNLILKKAVENAQKGYTEYGQPVPSVDAQGNPISEAMRTAKAEYSIAHFLNKISPDLSELFTRIMTEGADPSSVYYGKFTNEQGKYDVDKWLSLLSDKTESKLPSSDKSVVLRVGEEFNALQASLNGIKDSLAIVMAPTLQKILQSLIKTTEGAFLPDSQKLANDERNRAINEKSLQRLEVERGATKERTEALMRGNEDYESLLKYAPSLSTEDLASYMTGKVSSSDLISKYRVTNKAGFKKALKRFQDSSYYGNIELGVALTKLSVQSSEIQNLEKEIEKAADVVEIFTADEATISTLARRKYIKNASLVDSSRPYNVFGIQTLSEEERVLVEESFRRALKNENVKKAYFNAVTRRKAEDKAYDIKQSTGKIFSQEEIDALQYEIALEEYYKILTSKHIGQIVSPETKRVRREYSAEFQRRVDKQVNLNIVRDYASQLIRERGAQLRASEAEKYEVNSKKEDNRLVVEVISKDASGRELGRTSANYFTEMGGQFNEMTIDNSALTGAITE